MQSAAMRQLDRVLRKVADKEVVITFIGESGTGKEVLARRVHDLSARRTGPFVPINCAAIPEVDAPVWRERSTDRVDIFDRPFVDEQPSCRSHELHAFASWRCRGEDQLSTKSVHYDRQWGEIVGIDDPVARPLVRGKNSTCSVRRNGPPFDPS